MTPDEVAACVAGAAAPAPTALPGRGVRRRDPRHRRRLRRRRGRPHLRRRPHPLGPVLDIGLDSAGVGADGSVLLAIDAGNTQTVLGLFDGARAGRPLAHRHQRRAHLRRARPARGPVPRSSTGSSFDDVTGIVVSSTVPRLTAVLREMAGRYLGCRARSCWSRAPAAGCPSSTRTRSRSGPTASPTRWPPTTATAGPTIVVDFGTATTIDATSAAGRVPGRRHPARDRDQPRRPVRTGRRPLLGGAGQAPPRHREEHGRVGAVGRPLRLRRRGRRAVPALPGRAGGVHGRSRPAGWPS